ncbi:MAG: type I DNA topoisomerase [Exilispira sp.]
MTRSNTKAIKTKNLLKENTKKNVNKKNVNQKDDNSVKYEENINLPDNLKLNEKVKNMNNKKNLIVVESPTKVKTISNYVGKDFEVFATKGHIKDLPKYTLAIDIKNSFEPKYEIPKDKKEIIEKLIQFSQNKENIFLASDNDREGEAIAYHVFQILKEKNKNSENIKFKRIVFNEITKPAILKALENPGQIDIKKVDSQKARRVLDRLVGYQVSPILWTKILKGISAGRVQSVALRYIVEREEERENFRPSKYWPIYAIVEKKYKFELKKIDEKVYDPKNEKLKEEAQNRINNPEKIKEGKIESFTITNSSAKNIPPFVTSTLQQTAFRLFNYSPKKTMRIAQKLYEGIDIGKEQKGLITYMRTDSVRVSDLAVKDVKSFIAQNYGSNMVQTISNYQQNNKNVQDAHEAIRPTDVFLKPDDLKNYLSKEEYNIYSIIWERFVSAFMKPPVYKNLTIKMSSRGLLFEIKFKSVIEKNSLMILKMLKPENKEEDFPDFNEGDIVKITLVEIIEKMTEPPARYDEALLIKKLKDEGIGRPSTYATILDILYNRNYVVKENKKLVPTEIGRLTVNFLKKYFADIFDYGFTAKMEENLDKIESGDLKYLDVLNDFYSKFEPLIQSKNEMESLKDRLAVKTTIKCEKCGGEMILRQSKNGQFLGCSNYPECTNTKTLSYGICPKCNKGFIVKRFFKNKSFFGCSRYPDCDFITNKKIELLKCPKCGSFMYNEERTKTVNCINDQCDYKLKIE